MKDRLKMAANLNRIAAAIAMDRWEEIGENTNIWNPDEAAQDFECDPLYLIIMLQRNKMDADIPSILRSILKSPRDIDGYLPEIIPDDMMQAKTIRNYYRNILLVKTLKDEVITNQHKMLNTIVNNDKAINRELIPLLVRMPSMYIEDVETSEIFKQGTLPKKIKKRKNIADEMSFLGTVDTLVSGKELREYFFSTTKDRNLFCAVVPRDSVEEVAWKYISQQPWVVFTGTCHKATKPNHEFIYYNFTSNIEITK
mgnify:FL=1